jgi:hypothetical protein
MCWCLHAGPDGEPVLLLISFDSSSAGMVSAGTLCTLFSNMGFALDYPSVKLSELRLFPYRKKKRETPDSGESG